jgi:putative transposase
MFIAYKYKLLPTKSQTEMLSQWEGNTRWLWNYFLHLNTKQYEIDKKFIWKFDLKKLIPSLKKQYEWLSCTPAHALQNVAFNIDKALRRATIKRDQGFPKFKSKHKSAGSIKIDQVGNHIQVENDHIVIPKIGKIKWGYHRPISGKIKQISIIKEINDWYVSVVCDVDDVVPKMIDKSKTIGVDLGISDFAVLSDGTKINQNKSIKEKIKRKKINLKRHQRRLARKKKGSINRKKLKSKLAHQYRSITRIKDDWLHKTSHQLTETYDLICLEDLKIKDLVKGKNNRSLNRNIMCQSWGKFVNQLTYKAKQKGKHTIQIDQFAPSSKTCSSCGHKIDKLELQVREWTCPSCEILHDRDLNAAINIKFWGLSSINPQLITPGTGGSACEATRDIQTRDWYCQVVSKQEAAVSSVQR